MLSFEDKLSNLASLALRVGVNLQPGQRLILSGPLEATALLREIVKQAYEMGSPLVRTSVIDPQLELIRALHAHDDTLETVDQERTDMMKTSMERGDALLRVAGSDPALLASADPERVARISRAQRSADQEVSGLVQRSWMPWSIIACAVPAWAARVFPDLPESEAMEQLWDAIFKATRADRPDPVAAWSEHLEQLDNARKRLQDSRYRALHLKGPGTDLRVGLADDHVWESGGMNSGQSGQFFVANMPTEEVFTAPHASHVDGVISSSKPLSYQGQIIDGFTLTFRDGAVTDAKAEAGQDTLNKLLDMDDGARRLGEIALVPDSSPISRSGLLFFNTLFDENAASHVALGRAYPTSFRDGANRDPQELRQDGFNHSLVHVDFMFGSAEMDVDGENADGSTEPVMRAGAWAF